jgi:hypothetical protein
MSGLGGLYRGALRTPRASTPLLGAVLSTLAVIAFGCSSAGTTRTSTPTGSAPVSSPTPPTSSPTSGGVTTPATTPLASPTEAATVGLSGTWSGQYSGAYQGTFTLTWQQSGSNLSGSIMLSSPATTLPITGNVQGSAIRFGAVGGVTYSGSVSGNSMSGTYQIVAGSPGGSWSATRT